MQLQKILPGGGDGANDQHQEGSVHFRGSVDHVYQKLWSFSCSSSFRKFFQQPFIECHLGSRYHARVMRKAKPLRSSHFKKLSILLQNYRMKTFLVVRD